MNKCKISIELFRGVRSVVFQFKHCTIIFTLGTVTGIKEALEFLELLETLNIEIEVL